MADLEQVRDDLITSVYGRRLGLDRNDRLGGFTGIREGITEATSDTTGTNLPSYGWVTLVTSTNDTWILDPPVVGAEVKILTGSTSTGEHTVNTAPATMKSSFSTTQQEIVLRGGGAGCTLLGLSTSLWAVLQKSSTTIVQISS